MEPEPREEDGDLEHGVTQQVLKQKTLWLMAKSCVLVAVDMYIKSPIICNGFIYDVHISGQIIATSHDLTPNSGLVREIPLFQENLGWWNIIIWPDIWYVHISTC